MERVRIGFSYPLIYTVWDNIPKSNPGLVGSLNFRTGRGNLRLYRDGLTASRYSFVMISFAIHIVMVSSDIYYRVLGALQRHEVENYCISICVSAATAVS